MPECKVGFHKTYVMRDMVDFFTTRQDRDKILKIKELANKGISVERKENQ